MPEIFYLISSKKELIHIELQGFEFKYLHQTGSSRVMQMHLKYQSTQNRTHRAPCAADVLT